MMRNREQASDAGWTSAARWLQLLKGLGGLEAAELDGIEQQNLETTKMLVVLRKRVRDAPSKRRY